VYLGRAYQARNMKFLQLLERAWLAAIVIAVAMGAFNLITLGNFSYRVYTPFVCAGFCVLIYMNIRRQRIFLEKKQKDQAVQNPTEGQPKS
jgi:hypothetical protein